MSSNGATWTRGRACGIDNCESNRYRVLNGQRFCENGHVRGDIQIDDDEYEGTGGRGTRRKTMVSRVKHSPAHKKSKRAYGQEALKYWYQSFQYLLKIQVEFVIKEADVKVDLMGMVKQTWLIYLSSLDELNFNQFTEYFDGNESDAGATTDNGTDYEMDFDVSDIDSATQTSTSSKKRKNKPTTVDLKTLPLNDGANCPSGKVSSFKDSIIIIYLSCLLLSVPIYYCDLISWIKSGKLPYLKASNYLPEDLSSHLANFHMRSLHALKIPSFNNFFLESRVVYVSLQIAVNNNINNLEQNIIWEFPRFNWRPLGFKIIRDYLFPPEVYIAVRNLVAMDDNNMKLKPIMEIPKRNSFKRDDWPEVQVIASTFYCLWLWLHYNDTYNVDIKVWKSLIDKGQSKEDKFLNASFKDVITWDQSIIKAYMAWFQKLMIPKSNELPSSSKSKSLRKERLFELFKLDESIEVSNEKKQTFESFKELQKTITTENIQRHPIPVTVLNSEDIFEELKSNELTACLMEKICLDYRMEEMELVTGIKKVETSLSTIYKSRNTYTNRSV